MRLTKAQREAVRQKFGGRCAYCGELLGERWHADHFKSVVRDFAWVSGAGFRPTGQVLRPENDMFENFMPSCAPCNIDKGPNTLEWWHGKLQRATEVLMRNNPTYRHARRFGLVSETDANVVFYFEKI